MKTNLTSAFGALLTGILVLAPSITNGQSEKAVIKKYLSELQDVKRSNDLQRYRMTAIYTNRDLYGNFTGKTRVSGEFTRGFSGDSAKWNNVFISASNNYSEPFSEGKKQEYIENFRYIPSVKMLDEKVYKNFPSTPESIFARNLIWDMLAADVFAWNYYDSLKLNVPYKIPGIKGQFKMAEIGNYTHNKISLCWRGITQFRGEICAIIDFSAIDNKIELSMDMIKTKGTEQYWGTLLVNLKNKNLEKSDMYSGTIQEIEVKGMKDKILMKTIREIAIDKIQ